MIAEYQILVDRKDQHLMFVDKQGQPVSIWDVLRLASVAGCAIVVKKSTEKVAVVDFLSVTSDVRFSPEQAKILIGLEVE